jgi:hypothetical protein
MSLEFNAENRNANIVVRRCCSFCRRPGHNITRCNSETIHMFERNVFAFIETVVSERQDNILIMASLRHYLLNEALLYPSLVRAFAISRCGAHSRSNMDHCIIVIIQYFMMELIHHTETNNQSSIQPEILVEDSQLVDQLYERGRQIEFSQLGIRELIENETNLYASMFADIIRFIDIVRRMSETSEINRKFQIKTKISERLDNLEEKCECNICYEEREKKMFVKLDCGHEFCKDCIKQSLQNEQRQKPCCAFCRADITSFELKLESIKDDFNDLIIT